MYFFNACVGVVLVVVLITNVSCDTCVPMTLPPDDNTLTVDVWVNFIGNIDPNTRSAEFDFTVSISWVDARDVSSVRYGYYDDYGWARSYWVDFSSADGCNPDTWSPALIVSNAKDTAIVQEDLYITVDDPAGSNSYLYEARITGSVYCPLMDFRNFPFDNPEVTLIMQTREWANFEIYTIPSDYTNLEWLSSALTEINSVGAEKNVPTGDWEVTDISFDLGTPYNGILYDEVVLSATLKRVPTRYLFRIVLPITMITVASFVVFFMHDDFATRIETSSTMMLAVIAFLFLVSSEVPNGQIPLPTRLDKFIISCFVLIFFTTMENVLAKVVYSGIDKPFKRAMKLRSANTAPQQYPETAIEMLEQAQNKTVQEKEQKEEQKRKWKRGWRRCMPKTPSRAIDFVSRIIFPMVLAILLIIFFAKDESV